MPAQKAASEKEVEKVQLGEKAKFGASSRPTHRRGRRRRKTETEEMKIDGEAMEAVIISKVCEFMCKLFSIVMFFVFYVMAGGFSLGNTEFVQVIKPSGLVQVLERSVSKLSEASLSCLKAR